MTATTTAAPTAYYTGTTVEDGAAVHHLIVLTFANLGDRVGTPHHFTARVDGRGFLSLDGEGAMATLGIRSRAREALYAAQDMRCQEYGWCHADCRKVREGGPLAFCSTPEEIKARRAARRAELCA